MNNNEKNYGGYNPLNQGNVNSSSNEDKNNIYSDKSRYTAENCNSIHNDGDSEYTAKQEDYSFFSDKDETKEFSDNYSSQFKHSDTAYGNTASFFTGSNNTEVNNDAMSRRQSSEYGDNFSAANNYQSISSYSPSGNYYSQQPQSFTQNGSKGQKPKKKKGKGAMAAVIAICIIASGAMGFGGGLLANNLSSSGIISGGDGMTVQRVINTVNTSSSDEASMTTSEITDAVADSVVEITTETVQTGTLTKQYITSGAGSGVIIAENGYIITNNHVISGAEKIVVTLRDGTTYDAEVVGKDSQIDVALLKVDATGLKAAVMADSEKIKVGEKCVAIGNPLGQLGGTVTEGIVSALNRDLVIDGVTMNLLQTSAAINPGNSGGGLFNDKGELIGLVVAKTVDEDVEGLGFAIPINHVSEILGDLKEVGYVTGRAEMGVTLLDVANSQTAMMYGVKETGVYVSEVTKDQAEKAGFNIGDRITAINGTEVSSISEVKEQISKSGVGDTIKVTVDRDGKTQDLSLVLGEQTPEEDEEATEPRYSNGYNGGNYGSDNNGSIDDYLRNFFN